MKRISIIILAILAICTSCFASAPQPSSNIYYDDIAIIADQYLHGYEVTLRPKMTSTQRGIIGVIEGGAAAWAFRSARRSVRKGPRDFSRFFGVVFSIRFLNVLFGGTS